jgi:hypothetical protein
MPTRIVVLSLSRTPSQRRPHAPHVRPVSSVIKTPQLCIPAKLCLTRMGVLWSAWRWDPVRLPCRVNPLPHWLPCCILPPGESSMEAQPAATTCWTVAPPRRFLRVPAMPMSGCPTAPSSLICRTFALEEAGSHSFFAVMASNAGCT